MVGPPRPWLPRGKRFGNRLPMLPSRSGSVFLAAAGSTWLPARPDTRLMVPAHAGLRPASLPTTDSNMPCTCPSELSGSYILLRRALRSRLSEPMGVQIGGEIPPSTTTGPSDHRPPFVCSNSAHPPSILQCHPPSCGHSPLHPPHRGRHRMYLAVGLPSALAHPPVSGGPSVGPPPSREIIDSLIRSARAVN